MARMKKTVNRDIQSAQRRLDGMKAIDPELDLGEGISVATFEAAINKPVTKISQYNSLLSQADELLNEINDDIKDVNEMSVKALLGGGFKFGKNSSQYEMMGGTRTSERKKPVKKKTGETA